MIVDLRLHCFPQGATQLIYKILIVLAPGGHPGQVNVPIQFRVTWGHLLGMGHRDASQFVLSKWQRPTLTGSAQRGSLIQSSQQLYEVSSPFYK